jgi:hypothetical protein
MIVPSGGVWSGADGHGTQFQGIEFDSIFQSCQLRILVLPYTRTTKPEWQSVLCGVVSPWSHIHPCTGRFTLESVTISTMLFHGA